MSAENGEPLTIAVAGVTITASMDEWRAVERAISDRRHADRLAYEARMRAAGQVWTVELCSCGSGGGDSEDEVFGVDELRELFRVFIDSDTSIRAVTTPDGVKHDAGEYYTAAALIARFAS